jgi:hypothetical protein
LGQLEDVGIEGSQRAAKEVVGHDSSPDRVSVGFTGSCLR